MKDVVVEAMEEYSGGLKERIDELEEELDEYENKSTDDMIEELSNLGLSDDQIDSIRAIIGLPRNTLADRLKEEIWEEARDRYDIDELEMRLK